MYIYRSVRDLLSSITRSRSSLGTDHRASIEVNELADFVHNCAMVYQSVGHSRPRTPSQGELANRQSLSKSLALCKPLSSGSVLTAADLILVSPGTGFAFNEISSLIGSSLSRDCPPYTILKPDDIVGYNQVSHLSDDLNSSYRQLRSSGYLVGIPVRYHDCNDMFQSFSPDLLEFHMSDRDLDLTSSSYLDNSYSNTDLVVHAVEQYEDGFILDLASSDSSLIKRSFNEIDRLISHIDQLRLMFRSVERVPVVLNLGGFTHDSFLTDDQYSICRYRYIFTVILSHRHPSYLFLPQTMPPFPWHQGGRNFHNILTSNDRIADFLDHPMSPYVWTSHILLCLLLILMRT